jgi:hypothetical protein
MTTTLDTRTPGARSDTARRHATGASQIVCFGTLAWIGYVWLAASLVYAVVVTCVARWGSVDESLWQSVASGWQRYVVFGAGVSVSTTFLRIVVRNGATRRTLSIGATATMAVVAVLLAAWNVAGYTAEKVVYDRLDWPQQLRSDAVFTWGDLPRAAIDNGIMIAAYYATGWIVGVCYARWGAAGGTLRLLPALSPAAAMEFVVATDFGGVDVDALASWRDRPALWVTLPAGLAVVAGATWAAGRLTRGLALR